MAARSRCSASRRSSYAGAKSDDGHVYVGGFSARMQPDGTGVEILGFNFRNSYEQTVTSFGDIFHNDNDDPPACRTTYLMEYGNLGFFSRDGKRFWNADRRPGQSIPTAEWRQEDPGVIPSGDVYGGGAPTGIVFNEGDGLGKKWRGLLLSAEAARNTIFGYFPKAQGAGYQLDRIDFLTSNTAQQFAGTDFKGGKVNCEIQTFFRPSDVAVGADGAIYVADWFDPRVGGHDDKDDTTSGAIYRIAPQGLQADHPEVRSRDARRPDRGAAQPRRERARARASRRSPQRGAAALPAVEKLLNDENAFIRARAVWLLARLGSSGLARVEALLGRQRPDDARGRVSRVAAGGPARCRTPRALARDPSPAVRREVALSLRDVPFESSRDLLLDARARLRRQGPQLSRSLGHRRHAARKMRCTRRSPPRSPSATPRNGRRRMPISSGASRPREAVPAFAARASAAALPAAERSKATTALGFIPTRDAANALLDVAQHGGDGHQAEPGAVVAHQLQGFALGRAGRRRRAQAARSLRSGHRGDQRSHGAAPPEKSTLPAVADIAKLRGDAKRGASRRGRLSHVSPRQGAGRRLRAGARWLREPADEATWSSPPSSNPSNDIAHGYDGIGDHADRRPEDPRPRAERRQSRSSCRAPAASRR